MNDEHCSRIIYLLLTKNEKLKTKNYWRKEDYWENPVGVLEKLATRDECPRLVPLSGKAGPYRETAAIFLEEECAFFLLLCFLARLEEECAFFLLLCFLARLLADDLCLLDLRALAFALAL